MKKFLGFLMAMVMVIGVVTPSAVFGASSIKHDKLEDLDLESYNPTVTVQFKKGKTVLDPTSYKAAAGDTVTATLIVNGAVKTNAGRCNFYPDEDQWTADLTSGQVIFTKACRNVEGEYEEDADSYGIAPIMAAADTTSPATVWKFNQYDAFLGFNIVDEDDPSYYNFDCTKVASYKFTAKVAGADLNAIEILFETTIIDPQTKLDKPIFRTTIGDCGGHGSTTKNIAKIGSTEYATLTLAVEAAAANAEADTITLLADTDESIVLPAGDTFDSTGATYTGTVTAPNCYRLVDTDGVYTLEEVIDPEETIMIQPAAAVDGVKAVISNVVTSEPVTLVYTLGEDTIDVEANEDGNFEIENIPFKNLGDNLNPKFVDGDGNVVYEVETYSFANELFANYATAEEKVQHTAAALVRLGDALNKYLDDEAVPFDTTNAPFIAAYNATIDDAVFDEYKVNHEDPTFDYSKTSGPTILSAKLVVDKTFSLLFAIKDGLMFEDDITLMGKVTVDGKAPAEGTAFYVKDGSTVTGVAVTEIAGSEFDKAIHFELWDAKGVPTSSVDYSVYTYIANKMADDNATAEEHELYLSLFEYMLAYQD